MLIIEKMKGWALTALAVLLVLVGAYAMGGRASRKAVKAKTDLNNARREAAGAKGVHDATLETNKLPDGDAGIQLRNDWMRRSTDAT